MQDSEYPNDNENNDGGNLTGYTMPTMKVGGLLLVMTNNQFVITIRQGDYFNEEF